MSPSTETFLASLNELLKDGQNAFASAYDPPSLEDRRSIFFGRRGRLRLAQQQLQDIDHPEQIVTGQRFNEVMRALEKAYVSARDRLSH